MKFVQDAKKLVSFRIHYFFHKGMYWSNCCE